MPEESHKRGDFINNVIFRFAQEGGIKHVIVSDSETIQSIDNQNQLQGNKYAPTSKSKISVLPQGVDMRSNSLAPCGRGQGEGLKVAFTLAEVLITLGIIGVVAALTLPTLIQNYKKQVYVNQLKKTYATLSEGFKQIVANEGCTTLNCAGLLYDGGGVDVIDFSKENVPQKFIKTFKLENTVSRNLPNDSIYHYDIKLLNGEDYGEFTDLFITTDDEFLLGTTIDGKIIAISYTLLGAYVVVDINGLKSPNTLGRDIFVLGYFDYKDSVMISPWFSANWYNYMRSVGFVSVSTEEERITSVNGYCSPNAESLDFNGITCAEKIIMDGWKMNY